MRGSQTSIIPYVAIIVLIIGSASAVYVHAVQSSQLNDPTTIIINNEIFQVDTIFNQFSNTTIVTDDGEKTGVKLSLLLLSTDLPCPSCHMYTMKASDGYQQTVTWDDMEKGVLTMQKRTYFPDLAHSFWIRDIISIEVN
jgi:hypothetical protein